MNARSTILNNKSLALKSMIAAALVACCMATAAPGEELHSFRRPVERVDANFGTTPAGETQPDADGTGSYNPDPAEHEQPDFFGGVIKIEGLERHQYQVEIPAGLNLFSLETLGDTPLMIAIYDVKGGLIAAEPMSGGIACGLMVEALAPMTVVIEIYNPGKFTNSYVLWMNG